MQINSEIFAIKGKLAIACSGGIDSLALTILLAEKHDVIALIVNHNLRKAATREAERTKKILDKLAIENKILAYKGTPPTRNLMENARELRYKLLLDYCRENKIRTLATAHHADDNAENFLLRLARGSGVDGLSAIPMQSKMAGITIIRPLLNTTKEDLKKFLTLRKIKWVEDATNKTSKYKRNSLRHALNKLEDKELITKRINDASVNLARVRDYLEKQTVIAVNSLLDKNQIELKKLQELHEEIAFRAMMQIITKFSPKPQKPRFSELKGLIQALFEGKRRTLAGLIFTPNNNKIIVTIEK